MELHAQVYVYTNKHRPIWQGKGRKNSFHSMRSDVSSGCLRPPRSNSHSLLETVYVA